MTSPRGNVYMPALVPSLQKKYGFLGTPQTLDDFDASRGIRFLHGNFNGTTIDELCIYPDGVSVIAKANTNLLDKFIDDLISFSSKEFDLTQKEIPHRKRMYSSEMEISLERDIASQFEKFSGIYKKINGAMSKFADNVPDFKVTGIVMNYDVIASPHMKPDSFILDRRTGNTFDTNLYYTRAPLPTDAHLEILQDIEKIL